MKYLVTLLLGLAISSLSYGQQTTRETNKTSGIIAHFSLGNGIAGGAGLGLLDTTRQQTKTKTPVVTLGADYRIGRRFSVGLITGYQSINVIVSDSANRFLEEGNINRIYFGIRGLWHYGRNDRVDLYSGFKLGTVSFSTGQITGALPRQSVLEAQNNRTRYSLGIIPIGARFLITDQFGAHVQMSIGAPTFLSGGVNYMF